MKQVTVLTSFNRLSCAALSTKAHLVLGCMRNNPHFTQPSPTVAAFTSQLEIFNTATTAASNGDRVAIAIKNQEKAKLVSMLNQWASYVGFASMGNEAVALSSGFDIKKPFAPAPLLEPPGILMVSYGKNEGELVLKIAAIKGATSYLHQYTTDSSNPDGWQTVTSSRSKCLLRNLQPGTRYYVRVAVIGTRQQLLYSPVISRIAV